MGNTALAPLQASKLKAESARLPAMKPAHRAPTPTLANFLSSAGNMAIQRAASGPLAGNPAAAAIMGGANMSSGGCTCTTGSCEECKKKPMQRKSEGDASAPAHDFHSAMGRSGSGAPLAPHTRAVMEERFGQSFDDVRIHSDGASAEAARGIQAHAFTTGRDIYFGQGRYEPHTIAGQKLLAHELTHVLQQRRGAVQPGLKSLTATAHDDAFEHEAEQVERHFEKHDHGPMPLAGETRGHGSSHAWSGGKSVQRKCACGGTCSKCSGEPAATVPQELKNPPIQRKAEHPSAAEEELRRRQEESAGSATAGRAMQRKCSCGGTCSKCSGQSSQSSATAPELKKPPLQRKAEDALAVSATAPQRAVALSPAPEQPIQRKCSCGGGTCSKCSEEEGKAPAIQRKAENTSELAREKAHSTHENRVFERQGRRGAQRNERSSAQQAKAAAQGRTRSNRPVQPGRRPTFAVQRAASAGAGKAAGITRSDKHEREANTAANDVAHGRQVSAEKISDLGQQTIQPLDWEWCNPFSDPDCGLSSTADVVTGEASEIADDVWNAAQDFANFVGGVLDYLDNLLTITIPPMHVCDPHSIQFTLSEIEQNIPFIEGAVPLAEGVDLTGEVGLHLGLIPEISLQVGPCETHAITIAIHPISMSGSVTGGFDLTLGLGLGAEARAGIYGEVGVDIVLPDPPILLHAPIVNIQAGLAGFARAIAADQMSVDFSASAGLTGFSFSEQRSDNLGFALDLGLAGYGALSVLGANLCTLYWPLYEAHKEATLSLGLGLDLDVSATSLPSLNIDVDKPEWNRVDWGDLGIEFQRDMFKDDCPLCAFFDALGLFPSRIGGPWPFHPTAPWAGPLADIYPINPKDKLRSWHGGKCRGACGVDCSKCRDIGDVYVCEQIGDHHRIWRYQHFNICPTHEGCRDHDACYDWCANKLYERGPMGIIFGPCHRMCDLECVCEHNLPQCVNWIFGKGGDGVMLFSEEPKEIGGCLGPCPKTTKSAGGATSLKTCLPDVVLFDRIEGFSAAFSRKTPKFPVIKPIIFEVYGIPCVVTVDAFATFEAFISAGLGPALLKNACMELDLGTGEYHGTGELHVFADISGLVQIKGGLDAELSVACLISVLKVKPRLIATASGQFHNDLFAKVDISCCGGNPVLDVTAGLTPCLKLAFDLDAALDVDLFGFNLFSETWNLAHKDWKKCWPIEFDVFSLGHCGKSGAGLHTAGAGAAPPLALASGGPGGPSGGGHSGGGGAGSSLGPRPAAPGAPGRAALANAILGPHNLDDKAVLKDMFAMASHGDQFPDFPADPAADSHTTNPCPVPSAPTGLSCADAIHMRWYKPDDIYPNPIKLDGINYPMVGPRPAPPPDTHQNVGVDPVFMPSIGKCLELDPQPRVGNQGRYRTLLQNHGFDWNSPAPMQPDHVQDVFWKGPDQFDNLWPLDAFKNQSAGSRQNLHQEIEFADSPGGPVKRMTMKEFKKTQWEPDPTHKRRFFKIGEILF